MSEDDLRKEEKKKKKKERPKFKVSLHALRLTVDTQTPVSVVCALRELFNSWLTPYSEMENETRAIETYQSKRASRSCNELPNAGCCHM